MNDLKKIIHELGMQYAASNSSNAEEFVGQYITAITKASHRLSEIEEIYSSYAEFND